MNSIGRSLYQDPHSFSPGFMTSASAPVYTKEIGRVWTRLTENPPIFRELFKQLFQRE